MAEQHGKTLVPQIRFAGFTDPWEQRKLGELFEESDERASDREILSVSVANGIYPASESDRETNPGASLANYKIVHFGDVVYNSMRMWQGAVDASRYDGIVSPAYVVTRPNSEVYARFFARLLRQPMLLKQYQQVSQGNSKDTQVLKFDDFASIGISMPASENEQRHSMTLLQSEFLCLPQKTSSAKSARSSTIWTRSSPFISVSSNYCGISRNPCSTRCLYRGVHGNNHVISRFSVRIRDPRIRFRQRQTRLRAWFLSD